MQTLAGAGAKVLNADAVEFAKRAGIAIHARKTGDVSGRESVVDTAAPMPTGVVAIATASAVTRMRGEQGELGSIIAALSEVGARVMGATRSGSWDLLVDRTGVPSRDPHPVVERARRFGLVADDVSVVSVIGTWLLSRGVTWEVASATLRNAGIDPEGMQATDTCVSFVIAPVRCNDTVRLLHDALIPTQVL